MTATQRELLTHPQQILDDQETLQLQTLRAEQHQANATYAHTIRPRFEIAPPLFDPAVYEKLEAIARQVEEDMPEVISHGYEVSEAGTIMMRMLGCSPVEIERARVGLILHDVGKIKEKELIRSGKRFDREERERVHAHPIYGEAVLHDMGLSVDVIDTISEPMLFHHENYGLTQMPHWVGFENEHDTGYPYKIHGKDIPLSARVARYADIYCGLRKERPYKRSWSVQECTDYIHQNIGGIFDPDLYFAFMAAIPQIEAMLAQTSAEQQVSINQN